MPPEYTPAPFPEQGPSWKGLPHVSHQEIHTPNLPPMFSPVDEEQRLLYTTMAESSADEVEDEEALRSGMLLRQGRYCLQEMGRRQKWGQGAIETMWMAKDAQRVGIPVAICEVQLPGCGLLEEQAFLRRATIALTSIGRHARIPTLWDVFSEQGRHFFVFEQQVGETLKARMQPGNNSRSQPVAERDILECAIQIAELLEVLSQQSPPLIHGYVQPEHILMNRLGTAFLLFNYSPLLAGGGMNFIQDVLPDQLSLYIAPEALRPPFDGRIDIYALIMSMYHAVTGQRLQAGIQFTELPEAQYFNPVVSIEMNTILLRGLHIEPDQRYQSASALLTELRALQSLRNGVYQQSGSLASVQRLWQSGRISAVQRSRQEIAPTLSQPEILVEDKRVVEKEGLQGAEYRGGVRIDQEKSIPEPPWFFRICQQGFRYALSGDYVRYPLFWGIVGIFGIIGLGLLALAL